MPGGSYFVWRLHICTEVSVVIPPRASYNTDSGGHPPKLTRETIVISSIKGTRDILPSEIPVWHFVEGTCADIFHRYGFEEIRLPIFEATELFARGIGDATDIVEKEMYTFPDRNGLSLTLRPEGTASVARAYIQHRMDKDAPLHKLYYTGPMFRYERPQKGRYRQFYQIGAEVLGSPSPAVEAEILDMLVLLLSRLEIPQTTIWINSIGCPACRPAFLEQLQAAARSASEHLCEDCRRRAETNALRILDCKVPSCQETIAALPQIAGFLCGNCQEHHRNFTDHLQRLGIAYQENPRMVRGLDYYIRTTFEITCGSLGAQNSLLGGGRYDNLISQLGGPPTHGFGFALGLDRFVLSLPESVRARCERKPLIHFAPLGDEAFRQAMALAAGLRRADIHCSLEFEARSLKGHLRQADKAGARFVAILGDEEVERRAISLKSLADGSQESVTFDALAPHLHQLQSGGASA